MYIGACCFRDSQIVSIIESYDVKGKCAITGLENTFIYDTQSDNYLVEYFEEVIDVFTPEDRLSPAFPKDKLNYLRNMLFDWDIFSVEPKYIQNIIASICTQKYIDEPKLFKARVGIKEVYDTDYMNNNGLLKTYSWDEFSYFIRYVNRYHSEHINSKNMANFFSNINMTLKIKEGDLRLYRSRIGDIKGYKCKDMGAPPVDLISVGRANSGGIQCLYMADDVVTTFHEIKARELDYVTVGEFMLKRNKSIEIVDLSYLDNIGPFSNEYFDKTWFAINIETIRKIGDEIAKPMRRYDSELDYIPTQYICDFIKHLGYDGIKYKSTLDSNGNNYAMFDESKFTCINTKVCHVNSLTYNYV